MCIGSRHTFELWLYGFLSMSSRFQFWFNKISRVWSGKYLNLQSSALASKHYFICIARQLTVDGVLKAALCISLVDLKILGETLCCFKQSIASHSP